MIGVLLVPLAMSFRPDSNKDSVRTEVISGASVELPEPGESAVVADAPAADVSGSDVAAATAADASPAEQSSEETPAAPTTSPPVAAVATEQPETTPTSVTSPNPHGQRRFRVRRRRIGSVVTGDGVVRGSSRSREHRRTRSHPCVSFRTPSAPATTGSGSPMRPASRWGSCCGRTLATVATPIYPGDDICLPEGATLPAPPTAPTAAPTTTPPPSTSPPSTATTKPATTTTTAPTTTVPGDGAAARGPRSRR